ncbi:UDP-N-acetylmuramate dehydrogenase [Enterococcus cecorum]|nr:UDP-N-acetylmuramate dehydrogenase [Enterococcus cecorum]CAI3251984.1 UDP-N-acetylmuramate dehydrogenase [Enterococcus cecorum]CAI3298779.1 UDP-N-acetylmuramate dehydrogenase [Enterococcus cecorum]CAI3315143.1 UDP-N-acetylmuramate dehydrogenase [Enterococcus cecorum]CAI3333681.1 UDP-N-acetylmuramate dehydrogenase [Enterococcus cecorum]
MFASLKEITILKNEPLNKYTFTKTGGPADFLAFPKSVTEVKALLEECRKNNLPWMVLGNASNLIVRDGGIRGLVIMLEKLNHIEVKGNQITSQAGAKLIDTTYVALEHHLTGFEFACGIPGSIGGAVFMNAGAYGGEIKDVFVSCEVLYPDGQIKTLSAKEMAFSYRHSAIQKQHCIVLSATFALQAGNYAEIKAKMDELTHLRASKQPLEYPSCGSVFKRPVGHYTGPLIEQAGLKGMTIGGAQVSEKHAGFIVNINHATATDYVNLIQYIQKVIKEKFDVTLETEVRIIGEEVQ